jgi:hypothetical protein
MFPYYLTLDAWRNGWRYAQSTQHGVTVLVWRL